LSEADASDAYLTWLSDPEVNRYLEVRFSPPRSRAELVDFIIASHTSTDTLLLGMISKAHGGHIGNIKLGPINFCHHRADIGLVIGMASEWGKGLAREAITALALFAFRNLGLRKVTAGCYGANLGSYRAFIAAGFHEEARLAAHWSSGGEVDDAILLAIHNPASAAP